MKTNKAVALTLAAIILTSGIGTSAAVAAPSVTSSAMSGSAFSPNVATPANASLVKVAASVVSISNVGSGKATISWTKPAVTGTILTYKLRIMQGTKTVKTTSFFGVPAYSKTVTGLDAGKKYTATVEVTAMSQNGQKTVTSRSVAKAFTTTQDTASIVKVNKPTISKVSATYNSVSGWWSKPAVTGKLVNYTVVLKQGNKTIKTVTKTNASHKFTGLSEKTGYTVQVRANAVSANGKYKTSSAYSSVKKVTTATTAASTVKVNKPSLSRTSATSTSVSAWWKKPSVTGKFVNYTVVLKQGSKHIKTVTKTNASHKFTGLKKNTTYTVYVKANAKSANAKYKASSAYMTKNVTTNR